MFQGLSDMLHHLLVAEQGFREVELMNPESHLQCAIFARVAR